MRKKTSIFLFCALFLWGCFGGSNIAAQEEAKETIALKVFTRLDPEKNTSTVSIYLSHGGNLKIFWGDKEDKTTPSITEVEAVQNKQYTHTYSSQDTFAIDIAASKLSRFRISNNQTQTDKLPSLTLASFSASIDTLDMLSQPLLSRLNLEGIKNSLVFLNLYNLPEIKLKSFSLKDFPKVNYLNLSYHPELENLDVSTNPDLVSLIATYNNIAEIDLSKNTELRFINLSNNNLKSLNIATTKLNSMLWISNNKLNENSFSIAQNEDLTGLRMEKNNFSRLDMSFVGEDNKLKTLYFEGNKLSLQSIYDIYSCLNLELVTIFQTTGQKLDSIFIALSDSLDASSYLPNIEDATNTVRIKDDEGEIESDLKFSSNNKVKFKEIGDYFLSIRNSKVFSKANANAEFTPVAIDIPVKVTYATSCEGLTQEVGRLVVYPNPAKDKINIANAYKSLRIYCNGAFVLESKGGASSIDISALSSGLYTIEAILLDGKKAFGKIVKY